MRRRAHEPRLCGISAHPDPSVQRSAARGSKPAARLRSISAISNPDAARPIAREQPNPMNDGQCRTGAPTCAIHGGEKSIAAPAARYSIAFVKRVSWF